MANNVYQTLGSLPVDVLETKNGLYHYQNLNYTLLEISQGELYERMKGNMQFPKPSAMRYETKDKRMKSSHFFKVEHGLWSRYRQLQRTSNFHRR